MYTVEYYKTKKEKPTIKNIKLISNNHSFNRIKERRYLYKKDKIEKCWNIKSLTIDIDDINKIIYDQRLIHLYSLYAIVTKKISSDNSITSITILNNNDLNLSYIYEIINCEWMVNSNENIDEIKIERMQNRLERLKKMYNNATSQKKKIGIEYNIYLISYYLDTIKKHNEISNKEKKNIKLGKRFIKRKEELKII